ncbi:MAG: polyprenol monophosphomannose synthase [Acidobacteriota bacterium]
MKTALVIPTYNERENVRPLVEAIRAEAPGSFIVIVDDNSPDGTGEVAESVALTFSDIHVIHRPRKQGYGRALTAGFRYVLEHIPEADSLLTMDADFSHQPRYLPALIEALARHDVVIGSRYSGGGGVENWSVHRRILSRLGNRYVRWVAGLRLADCTSGFVAYRRKVIESIPLESLHAQGYSFLIEMKFRCSRRGFSTIEIPIVFVERQRGASKMSAQIAVEAVMLVWKLRFRPAREIGGC